MKGYKQKEKSPPSFQVKLLKSFYGFTVFYGTVGLALFLLFLVL